MKLAAKKKLKRRVFIFMIALSGLAFLMDLRLRPVIKTAAASKAQVISTNAINEAVLRELESSDLSYSDLVTIERAADGEILAVTTNAQRINRLKAKISVAIQEELSKYDVKTIELPLGALLGNEITSGWGPSIPLKISVSGCVSTEFCGEFREAGINQTKHQIYLNVHTKISALVPGYPSGTEAKTNMTVAETIIVGRVPRVYAGSQIKEAREAAGLERIGE